MGFWIALATSLVVTVVGELLRPKQNPMNAKPSSLDDFDVPTAEEGRTIPVICGKVKIDGPNVTWYGDLGVVPLKKKVKTGLFSSKRQTYGYKYYLGMQMFLCHAREDLDVHEIRFGDKMPSFYTRTDEANGVVRFDFNDENFWGGKEKEGGVSGTLRFYRGRQNQPASDYFSARIGKPAPAYQGYAYAMLEKMYLGTSAYLKPIGYVVSSYPNTLGVPNGHHKIGEDANPVCFIYEIMNDPVWGLNINPARFDIGSFLSAAETCYQEGYGISMIVNSGSAAADLLSEVLRHIDGVVFTDPATGLITIKLARADYDPAAIPEFGPDDFLEGVKFSRASWSQTKNTIKVTYVDRSKDFSEAVVSQQDLSNIMQREGEIATEQIDFRGFSTFTAASRACARALKTYGYPLAKMSGAVTRRAWSLRPGSVFRLNWPSLGIESSVMRVTRIDYGNIRQNRISIDATEDIFAISKSAYTEPTPDNWVDPVGGQGALARQAAAELPYPLAPVEGSVIGTFGSQGSVVDEGYIVTSDRESPFDTFTERAVVRDFTPSAVTVDPIPLTSAAVLTGGVKIQNIIHGEEIDISLTDAMWRAGNTVARIVSSAGEEWVAFLAVTKSGGVNYLVGVVRGIFDTVPLAHPAGAVVWFPSSGFGFENETTPYLTDATVALKLRPFNVRGILHEASAPTIQVTTSNRGSRPFPPGRIRVNGTHPAAITGTVTGAFVLSWEHRNRKATEIKTQDDTGVEPEAGTTYNIRAYADATNTLLAQKEGANANSASVTLAYDGVVRVEVKSVRDGLTSRAAQKFTLNYASGGATSSTITADEAKYVLDGGGA